MAILQSKLFDGTKSDCGTRYLADRPDMYDLQRSNNFELIVESDGDIPSVDYVTGTSEGQMFSESRAKEILRLSVSSSFVPHFTQDAIKIRRGNNEMKFAGTPTYGSGTIKINDFIGLESKEALMAWQNLSYNARTEKVGLAKDYKKTCTLVEYRPDYSPVRSWTIYGAWVSGISEDDYNYDSNDRHQVSATIEYDRAELTPYDPNENV